MPNQFQDLDAQFWIRTFDKLDDWPVKCAAPSRDIKHQTQNLLAVGDIGFHWHPELEKAAIFTRCSPTEQDIYLAKAAAVRAVGVDHVRDELLSLDEVSQQPWVKVAFSPTLRRTGELLNFFPGKYPGGVPNAPSPLAATLTGGLVGAGLGYGAGWLAEKTLPESWHRKRLRRAMSMLGGVAGATPGAAWAVSAGQRGRSLLDGSDLAGSAQTPQHLNSTDLPPTKIGCDLGTQYLAAAAGIAKYAYETFGVPAEPQDASAIEVNINQLGQTLWEMGATPQQAATTMGALYAAQQLPDTNAQPGFVTPHQTGLLGTMMGAAGGGAKGYATGWMAGKALGLLTGMPQAQQNTLKNTGLMLGIVNSLVPRLFQ